jgi:hypothetical protein
LNLQWQKLLQNQYFPHSESKFYQINSINQDLSNNRKAHSNSSKILSYNLISIFKNFCTTSPNIVEPSPCTPPHRELSKDTKNTNSSISVQWIS